MTGDFFFSYEYKLHCIQHFNAPIWPLQQHGLLSHRQNEFTLFSVRQSEGSVSDVYFIFLVQVEISPTTLDLVSP